MGNGDTLLEPFTTACACSAASPTRLSLRSCRRQQADSVHFVQGQAAMTAFSWSEQAAKTASVAKIGLKDGVHGQNKPQNRRASPQQTGKRLAWPEQTAKMACVAKTGR
eukprot:39170-Chlamydomonas_euryale.AAC.3